MSQLLIKEYGYHILHLYHPVTSAKENYGSIRAQDYSKWENGFSNEISRLPQGDGTRIKTGNEKILFLPIIKVPGGRKTTYANRLCDYRPHKDYPYHIKQKIGVNNLPYPS